MVYINLMVGNDEKQETEYRSQKSEGKKIRSRLAALSF
jgi:hypothetical protein